MIAFRGQPSSKHDPVNYGRTDAQRTAWENADPCVTVVYRPLRYTPASGSSLVYSTSSGGTRSGGHTPRQWDVQEKGIDVLCALEVVAQARAADIDAVILASHDTDLEPALDAALNEGTARVETCQWYNPTVRRTKWLTPTDGRKTWNTRLVREQFDASLDPKTY